MSMLDSPYYDADDDFTSSLSSSVLYGGSTPSRYGGGGMSYASSLMPGASLLSPSPKPSGLGLSSQVPQPRPDSPFWKHTQQEFLPPLPPSTPSQGVSTMASASVHHHAHTHTHNHFHHHVASAASLGGSPHMSRFDCMSPPPFTPTSKSVAAQAGSGGQSASTSPGASDRHEEHQPTSADVSDHHEPTFGSSRPTTPEPRASGSGGLMPPLPAPTPKRPTSHAHVLASADGDNNLVERLNTPPLCSHSCTPDSSVAGSTSSRMAHAQEGMSEGVRPVKYEIGEKAMKMERGFAQDASGDHDHEIDDGGLKGENIKVERERGEDLDVSVQRGEDPASFSTTTSEIRPQLGQNGHLPSPLDTSRSASAHSGSTTDDSPVHTPRYGAGKYGPGRCATGGKYSQYSSPAMSPRRFPSPVDVLPAVPTSAAVGGSGSGCSSPTSVTRLNDPHSMPSGAPISHRHHSHVQQQQQRITRSSHAQQQQSQPHHHLPSPGLPGLSSPISPLPSLYGTHSHPQSHSVPSHRTRGHSHSHHNSNRYAHDPAMQTIVHGPNSPYVNPDGSPRKPAKPRAGRTPMSEYPIGTLVTIRPEAYHSQKVRAKLAGFFGKTVRISCLPIYPDTWFGISLNGKEVKVRSSAFYRPEKDGVLPETPPNSTAGTGGNAGQANKKSSAGNGGASNGSSATTPTSASNGESGNDGGQSPTNGDSLGSYGKSKKRKRNDDRGSQPQSLLLNNNENPEGEIELPQSPSHYNPYKGGSYHCVCNSAHSSKRIFNRHQAQCALWHKFIEIHDMSCELATEYYPDERTSEDLAAAHAVAQARAAAAVGGSFSPHSSETNDRVADHHHHEQERYSKRARVDGAASAPMMYSGGLPSPAAGLQFPGTSTAAGSGSAVTSFAPMHHQPHYFNPYLAAQQSAAAMAAHAAATGGGNAFPHGPAFAPTPAAAAAFYQRNATLAAAHMNGMQAAAAAAAAQVTAHAMFPTTTHATSHSAAAAAAAAAAHAAATAHSHHGMFAPHPIAAAMSAAAPAHSMSMGAHMSGIAGSSHMASHAQSHSSVASSASVESSSEKSAMDPSVLEMVARQAPSHFSTKPRVSSSTASASASRTVSAATIPSAQTAFNAPPVAYTAPAVQAAAHSSSAALTSPPVSAVTPSMVISPHVTLPAVKNPAFGASSMRAPRAQKQQQQPGLPPPAPLAQHQPPHPPAPPAQGCPPPPPPPASLLPPNLVNGRYRRT